MLVRHEAKTQINSSCVTEGPVHVSRAGNCTLALTLVLALNHFSCYFHANRQTTGDTVWNKSLEQRVLYTIHDIR